jgi:hypothetical protein
MGRYYEGLKSEPECGVRVYHQTEAANGQVWVREKELRRLGTGWAQCFAV